MLSVNAVSAHKRVLAVAEEPELGEEVQRHDDDREPARPALAAHQAEPGKDEQDTPDQQIQPHAGQVDGEEALTRVTTK